MRVSMNLATIGVAVAALLGSSALATGASPAGEPVANASARSCNIDGKQTELGASYVTSLKVNGTSCRKAKSVVRGYHACRKDNGGADGKCNKEVQGYSCNEGKRDGVPGVQYSARVRCNRNGARVIHTYTQNT